MDRQRQTNYAFKPRERYAIMMQHYTSFAIVISVQTSSDIRFDGTIYFQELF